MKFYNSFIAFLFTLIPFSSHAITCSQIREKADATYGNKKTKTSCVLTEHTLGIGTGSTESVYTCKELKYRLYQSLNGDCVASLVKNK